MVGGRLTRTTDWPPTCLNTGTPSVHMNAPQKQFGHRDQPGLCWLRGRGFKRAGTLGGLGFRAEGERSLCSPPPPPKRWPSARSTGGQIHRGARDGQRATNAIGVGRCGSRMASLLN